jgi:hypothetical protein
MKTLILAGLKWTAIAVWFDLSDRIIGSPLDLLFAANHWTAWLDGYSNVILTGCK